VEDQPLAFCDPRTVVPEDCLAIDRVTPTSYSEVTYLKYNAAQEWYFLKHQRMDEVAVFVSYDSEGLGQSNCKKFLKHKKQEKTNFADSLSSCFVQGRIRIRDSGGTGKFGVAVRYL
jgi:hypothetical protein